MKSALAKARDKWLLSDEGKRCCEGTTTGQYLQNRLELAFLAKANFLSERIKKLETAIKKFVEEFDNIMKEPSSYVRGQKLAVLIGVIERALKDK